MVISLENAGDNTTVCPIVPEAMSGASNSAFGCSPNSTTLFYKALSSPGPWWGPRRHGHLAAVLLPPRGLCCCGWFLVPASGHVWLGIIRLPSPLPSLCSPFPTALLPCCPSVGLFQVLSSWWLEYEGLCMHISVPHWASGSPTRAGTHKPWGTPVFRNGCSSPHWCLRGLQPRRFARKLARKLVV